MLSIAGSDTPGVFAALDPSCADSLLALTIPTESVDCSTRWQQVAKAFLFLPVVSLCHSTSSCYTDGIGEPSRLESFEVLILSVRLTRLLVHLLSCHIYCPPWTVRQQRLFAPGSTAAQACRHQVGLFRRV